MRQRVRWLSGRQLVKYRAWRAVCLNFTLLRHSPQVNECLCSTVSVDWEKDPGIHGGTPTISWIFVGNFAKVRKMQFNYCWSQDDKRVNFRAVADALTKGHVVLPETYPRTTVYFGSIMGFKEYVMRAKSPLETVTILNDLYGVCDSVLASLDVFKVEVVVDAYLVNLLMHNDPKTWNSRMIRNISWFRS